MRLIRWGTPGRERLAVLGDDNYAIDVQDLPANLVHANQLPNANGETPSALEEQERRLVEEALRAAGGNQSEAARRLGIGRDALRYKMKRYEL